MGTPFSSLTTDGALARREFDGMKTFSCGSWSGELEPAASRSAEPSGSSGAPLKFASEEGAVNASTRASDETRRCSWSAEPGPRSGRAVDGDGADDVGME